MPNQEARLKPLEAARKELEDAFLATTHLEAKMGQMRREQAEYLAAYDARLKQSEQHNREIDEHIEKLVSAIGALIARKR
jgi:hypothetical protein